MRKRSPTLRGGWRFGEPHGYTFPEIEDSPYTTDCSGNLKPLPASRILALHKVIQASHVRLRFGKLCAVAFIRISTQRLLLLAH